MDAKKAAQIIKSGNFTANDFQTLYAALNGKTEFAEEFNKLRQAMLKSYADGESIEVNQAGQVDQQDVMVVDQNIDEPLSQEKQLKDVEPWKIQRRQEIMQWAAKNKNSEIADIKANKEGLSTSFKDGTQVNFVAENHVSVKTPEEPKAQNFDMVVALAKSSNKKIKLGEKMSPEFRVALIEACAKSNVQISNLSLEDLDTYMKFLPKQEEKQVLNVVEQKPQTQTQVRQQQDVAKEESASVVKEEQTTSATAKDNGVAQVVAAVAAHAEAREAATAEKPTPKKTSKDKGAERIAEQAAEAAAIAREIQAMARKQSEQKREQAPADKPVTETPVVSKDEKKQEGKPSTQQAAQGKGSEGSKQDIAFIPVARSLEEELEEQPVTKKGKEEVAETPVAEQTPVVENKGTKGKAKEEKAPVASKTPVAEKGKEEAAAVAETPISEQPGPQSKGGTTGKEQPVKTENKKQEPKKEGFWSKWGRKIKHAAIIAGVAVASFFVGRCSSTPTEQGAGNNDGEKARTEIVAKPTITPIVADTLQNDTTDRDFQIRMVPSEWDASMGITKKQFINMKKILHRYSPDGELWGRMHLNAQLHAAEFSIDKNNPMTAEQFMFKTIRMAAWSATEDELATLFMMASKDKTKMTEDDKIKIACVLSEPLGSVLGPVFETLGCGNQVDAITLEKAKIMLSSIDEEGNANVFTLDKIAPETSKYNDHHEDGTIIGQTDYVLVGLSHECGEGTKLTFVKSGKTPPAKAKPQPRQVVDTIVVKKDPVTIEIPGDTVVVKKDDVVIEIPGDTVVVAPTRAVPAKPKPEEKIEVNVGSRANLSARPAAEAVDHTQDIINNGSDQNLTGAQRRQARKMAKEMLESGRIDQKTYDAMIEEIKEPGARGSIPMNTNTGR